MLLEVFSRTAIQSLAIDRIEPATLVEASRASAEPPAALGIAASAGIAAGKAAFDSEGAQRLAAAGDPVILIRHDTSTADMPALRQPPAS